MNKQPLHEIMAQLLSGNKLEEDNVVGKQGTSITVDKDVKDPNQESIDTANIIKSAPTRENPNKRQDEITEEDVDGIADGILVVTDPEIASEEFEEVADELQGIVDNTEAGELPFTDKYDGDYILSCPICGGTFVNDTLLESGEDTCPICCKVPDAFVVNGKIENQETAIEQDDIQEDIEHEENLEEPVEEEIDEMPVDEPQLDEIEDATEDPTKKESKEMVGNKLQESKLEEDAYDDYMENEKALSADYCERVKKGITQEARVAFADLKDILDTETNDTSVDGFYFPSKAVAILDNADKEHNLNSYMNLTVSNILNMVDDNDTIEAAIEELFAEYKADSALSWADNFVTVLGKLDFDFIDDEEDLEEYDESKKITEAWTEQDFEERIDDTLTALLGEIYQDNGIKTGDIAPEEALEFEEIISRLNKLFNSLCAGNTPLSDEELDESKKIEEAKLNPFKDAENMTTADDSEEERAYYGKGMTKRDKVRGLDQAQRNLDRIGTDVRANGKGAVDQISYEVSPNKDIETYKNAREKEKEFRAKGNGLGADVMYQQGNKVADKIRAKGKKEEGVETKSFKIGANEVDVEMDGNHVKKIWWTDSKGSTDFGYDEENDKFVAFNNPNGSFLTPKQDEQLKNKIHKLIEGIDKVEEYIEYGFSGDPFDKHDFEDMIDLEAYIKDHGYELLNGDHIEPSAMKVEIFDPAGNDGEVYVYDIAETDKGVTIEMNHKDSFNMNESKKVEESKVEYETLDSDNMEALGSDAEIIDALFLELGMEVDETWDNVGEAMDNGYLKVATIGGNSYLVYDDGTRKGYSLGRASDNLPIVKTGDIEKEFLKEEFVVSGTDEQIAQAREDSIDKGLCTEEKLVEDRIVWSSEPEYVDENNSDFREWLAFNDFDDIDQQAEEEAASLGYDVSDEEIEEIKQNIINHYLEQYNENDNEALIEDWNENVIPMIESQLNTEDLLIMLGTAETWNRKGNAGKLLRGIDDFNSIVADYDIVRLREGDNGGLGIDLVHHDGTHSMNLYTFNGDYEGVYNKLVDLGESEFADFEDYEDATSMYYDEDMVEFMMDNGYQEELKEFLVPIRWTI